MNIKSTTALIVAFFFATNFSFAQLTLPPSGDNQKAVVTQYMGLTKVTVTYNSPNVHTDSGEDRTGKIWGELVPYGYNNLYFGLSSEENPSPWRAGANQNTTLSFSHDMKIGGVLVKAGVYGLFMVPTENQWEILLSKNSTSWGSYFFEAEDVVYRFNVTPAQTEFTEYLSYDFTDRELDKTTLSLNWENLTVAMPIEVPNIYEVYVEQMRADLKNYAGFNPDAWAEAATFCAMHNMNLDEALEWADYAMEGKWVGQVNFKTLMAKGQVLLAMNKKEEANKYFEKAVMHPSAVVFDVHGMGRKYIAKGKTEMAMNFFKWNAKAHPNQWPVNVGLMRGYSALGDYKTAYKYCKKALKNVDPKDDLNKENLEKSLALLKEGKDIN